MSHVLFNEWQPLNILMRYREASELWIGEMYAIGLTTWACLKKLLILSLLTLNMSIPNVIFLYARLHIRVVFLVNLVEVLPRAAFCLTVEAPQRMKMHLYYYLPCTSVLADFFNTFTHRKQRPQSPWVEWINPLNDISG